MAQESKPMSSLDRMQQNVDSVVQQRTQLAAAAAQQRRADNQALGQEIANIKKKKYDEAVAAAEDEKYQALSDKLDDAQAGKTSKKPKEPAKKSSFDNVIEGLSSFMPSTSTATVSGGSSPTKTVGDDGVVATDFADADAHRQARRDSVRQAAATTVAPKIPKKPVDPLSGGAARPVVKDLDAKSVKKV